jgi:hypothetical protein
MDDLDSRSMARMKELAEELTHQRRTMVDFQAYISWMDGSLAGYGRYLEAGSFAAGFAKYLPIPYAGQAGQLTKFVSHFSLYLSETAGTIGQFLSSSQQFMTAVEAADRPGPDRQHRLATATFLADQLLARDMADLQVRLETVSSLSASANAFLTSLQSYLGSTDDYWQKTKSLVSRKEAEKKERGALAESIEGLRGRAGAFNASLRLYDAAVRNARPRIASLVAYDELRQEIGTSSTRPASAGTDTIPPNGVRP